MEMVFVITSKHGERDFAMGAHNRWPFAAAMVDLKGRAFHGRIEIGSHERTPKSCEEFYIRGDIYVRSLPLDDIVSVKPLYGIQMEDERKGTFSGSYCCPKSIGVITVSFSDSVIRQGFVRWPDVPITKLSQLRLGDQIMVNSVAIEKGTGDLRVAWIFSFVGDTLIILGKRMEDDITRVRFGYVLPGEGKVALLGSDDEEIWLTPDHLFLTRPNDKIPVFVRC
jgi:hypothetical protein